VSPAWLAGAGVIAAACFVQGLTGFGIGLVALAFLPFLMPPATAVVLITIYATVFAAAMAVQLRREILPRQVWHLAIGTLVGMPFGVWSLAALPASALNRLIGLVLILATVLEVRGLYPGRLPGRGWTLGTGLTAGLLGGAVGTPGPPVILYGATQAWSPRQFKATFQAFLVVNQVVTLAGYWWAQLLTVETGRLALLFAVPAVAGAVTGMVLFDRVEPRRFRRMVFAILALSGAVLLVRG
jgi:uncharacterized membrane protein YfcA